ncbi:hypothetical protein [uncultured Litoreibacter sp.]|uniref:hypothetical protein n=1 Tax=uncultured Litoreibacter sp. TaxID=1392394 RepID=UPI00261B9447|nr:hypothetical protein [uncultured Litoreibacter sp.]
MSFRMPARGEVFAARKLTRLTQGEKRITIDFDVYYAGAVLGMCARKRISPEQYDAEIGRELTRTYPKERQENADTMAGMLIEAELSRQNIAPSNAAVILSTIDEYLSSSSQTRLTQEGHRLLDRYAAAGFMLLEERYMEFDYEEEFMVAYLSLLDEICETKAN